MISVMQDTYHWVPPQQIWMLEDKDFSKKRTTVFFFEFW